jgi:hypothetical protein
MSHLGQQEADVDRLVRRSVEAIDDDAVVDDADAEPDHVGLQALCCVARGGDRVVGDEVGIEELHARACLLGGRAQPLEPVGGHGRHPLERVGMHQEDPRRRGPGGGEPG